MHEFLSVSVCGVLYFIVQILFIYYMLYKKLLNSNELNLLCSFRHSVTFIGRNLPFSDDRHYKLCSNNFEQNVIISRRHARVIHCEESDTYSLHDDSMNGVFINDTKIDGKHRFQYY